MKSLIVFAMVVAVAVGAAVAPPGSEAGALVLRNDQDNIGVEGFTYGSETSNGIKQEAQGIVKNLGSEAEALEVRGFYSYPGPDGNVYSVEYVANEGGFQPKGAHLPSSVPV